ncbi:MAG: PKD domain-containing protein [Bacteroidota bacterium]
MFHRFIHCILLSFLLVAATPSVWAQDCPDTQPTITGADIACDQNASSVIYTYSTPATTGTPTHSYQWVVTPVAGRTILGSTTQNQLQVKWQTVGTYTVQVTEVNNDPAFAGCIGKVATKTIKVQPLLHAYFYYEFDPTGGCYYNIVNFTGNVSVSADPNVTYSWNFGDASPIVSGTTYGVLQHTFPPTSGVTYTVTLTVTNSAGQSDMITDYVYVNPDQYKPVATFSNSAQPQPNNCLYNPMSFDASASLPKPITNPDNTITIRYYEWDFDDPTSGSSNLVNTGTLPTVSHVFSTFGVHHVKLTIVNTPYCTATFTKDITIDNTIPTASFTNTIACLGEATQFTTTSVTPIGTITQLDWIYGDGTSYTSTNPAEAINHKYLALGTYSAKLRVTNSNNCISEYFIKPVSVNPAPMASFLVGNACLGEAVAFTNTSTLNGGSQISNFLWNFSDPLSGSNSSTDPNPTHMFSALGTYPVSLQVTNTDGCANTYTISPALVVNPKPAVNFTFQNGTQNWEILFHNITGASVGNNLVWDYGDGTYGYGPNPSHVYQGPGNFLVTLTATDAINGCSNSIQQQVSILGTQSAFFVTDSPKCIGDTMHFTPQIPGGNIVKEVWDFGDGNTVCYGATPCQASFFPVFATHVYTQAGTFTVTRTVTYITNFYESFSIQVVVYPLPTANFTFSNNASFPNTYACANQAVYFTDLSFSTSGNIIQWDWDFKDPGSGTYNNSVLQNPSHVFSGFGHYWVRLRVTDNVNNCTDTIAEDVFVHSPVPVAYTLTNNSCKNQVVTFSADLSVMTPANIATWDWDFGDGTIHSANPTTASHLYAAAGTYTSILTVTDVNGCTNSLSKTVNVMPLPVPGFSFASPTCDGTPVQFTDQSIVPAGFPGYITRWVWTWGDGTTTTVNLPSTPNVGHTFPIGVYNFTVKLTVTSSFGCTDSITHAVNVIPSPTAAFEVVPGSATCATQVVQFNDLSQTNGGGNIVGWLWNFDDPISGLNNTSTSPSPSHIFATARVYHVALTVTNANGCSFTDTTYITIHALPVAAFTATAACAGTATQFTDTSVPNASAIVSYSWVFGDGGTSTLQSPLHTYSTYGVYNATLTIINSNGCTQTITQQVTVHPNPVAEFTFSPASCISNPVTFTDLSFIPSGFSGYINKWVWDFGDGTARQTINYPASPNMIYTFAGTATAHVVKLIVTTTNGCTDSITKTVNSIPSPIANFTYSSTTCLGQIVHFTDLSQTNGGGSIQTWNWDFGDPLSGANNTSTLQNPNHSFTSASNFTVVLNIMSTNGCTKSDTIHVIINALPTADFTNTAACEGNSTVFTDASLANGGTIISYAWDFGDGTHSTLQSPVHTYGAFGTFSVTLTVVNSNGCIHSVTKQVTVNPKPVPDFTYSPASCVGIPVNFFNQSFVPTGFSSYINQWIWDFGDGTAPVTIDFPANPNITHTFAGTAVSHVVKLRVRTTNTCVDSISKTVTSIPTPVANFSHSNTLCLGQIVNFTDLTQTNGGGSIQTWAWNFGDGLSGANNTSTLQNPSHSFTAASSFSVTLTVTSSNGCVSDTVYPVTINALPTANFTTDTVCQGSATTFSSASSTTPAGTNIVSYAWNFGDGGTSTAQNPQHIFASYGFFSVTLVITNSNGCIHTVTKQVLVNPKPIADFTFSAASCVGLPVNFFNQSYVPSGYSSSINTWQWNFGDGSTVPVITFPANPNITHTFAGTATSHIVTLTVTTLQGCISVITKTVTSVPAPLANFSFSSTLCDNQPVNFTDLSQTNGGGSIQTWAWNFGDAASGVNNSSSVQNPVHQFSAASPPSFKVMLTVTNGNGCIAKDSSMIAINARPTSNFKADTACLGSITTFTDQSSASVTSRNWDFGDGQTSSGAGTTITHLYGIAGVYTVKLTVSTALGCMKDTTKQVLVLGKPVSLFSYSSPSCAGDSVQFNDLSTTPHGYIKTWKWDFNDGTPVVTINFPANQNVKHKFANGGNFNVKLTITTSDNCNSEKISQVQIGFHPMANFNTGPTPCALSQLQFTDLSQTNGGPALTVWAWNFGDPASGTNNTSSTQNPTHAFTAGGTDTVRLIVTNADGCFDTIKKTVVVYPAPVAKFKADTACMASLTTFTDQSTTATGTTIIAWAWDFGDPASGANNTSTVQNPTHTYNIQGTYTVHLVVTNSHQCPKDTSMVISVNPKPTAMFQYDPACVHAGTQFTDLSTVPGSSIQKWNWNFGDGTPHDTIKNPIHTFTTSGTFQVTLVVKNSFGCTDSVTIPVISRPKPVGAFTYLGFFCPKGKVDFQDQSTATGSTIISREWTFIPGYTSNISNPSFTFPKTDTSYHVQLVVTDTYGCKDTIIDSVYVKPGFTFAFTNDTVCQGYTNHFYPNNKTAGDSLYSVQWNFGDPSSGPNNKSFLYRPTHVFTAPGHFIVKMKAYDTDNCVDSVYQDVFVYALPKPLFTYVTTPCDSTIHFSDSTQNSSTGGIKTWVWKWGDTKPNDTIHSPGPGNIGHIYNSVGFYNVTLVIINQNNCMDSVTRRVQRVPCIAAGFSFKDTLCARYRIAFSDTSLPVNLIKEWHWSWGDGTLDTIYYKHNTPIYHTFADTGTYQVHLAVKATIMGATIIDNRTTTVTIHPTPLAYFANPPECLHNITLFKDTSKTWGEKNTSWVWTFTSKITDSSHYKNPGHKFDTAGIYKVKLVVMNKYGCKDSLTKPTRVYGLPAAHFDNTAACVGDPTFFTDKSKKSDTVIGTWRWFFDLKTRTDSSHAQNPDFKYPATGSDSVRLIVKDKFGCIDTVDSTIVVHITPVSAFTLQNGYDGKQGQIKLNNLSTGADTYSWEFGNGKSSTDKNPIATFTDDGTYIIKLISLNQFDCTDTTFLEYNLLFKGLYVPNAFAPASTNLGIRLFQPVGVNLKEYHVTVFDNWGHLMWESTKLDDKGVPTEGWDGTFEGNMMPQGNYMWKITATFVDESPWNGSDNGAANSGKTMGTVTLIR